MLLLFFPWFAFPLFLCFLASLISNCLSLLLGIQERSRKWDPFSTNEKRGHNGAFVPRRAPRGPAWFHSLLNTRVSCPQLGPRAGCLNPHRHGCGWGHGLQWRQEDLPSRHPPEAQPGGHFLLLLPGPHQRLSQPVLSLYTGIEMGLWGLLLPAAR